VITVGSVGLDNAFEVTWQEGGRSEVRGLETLLAQFARDEFDLVAVGRVLLSDPAWVAKVRDGRTDEIRPFSAEDRLRLS
jgi:2,4-dienoyl-CoA reductase-like NADH-dependent reductase (Old Yellow Enzyme family)